MDFKSGSSSKSSEIPQFKYLDLVLELELLFMQLDRSFHDASFELNMFNVLANSYRGCLSLIIRSMNDGFLSISKT